MTSIEIGARCGHVMSKLIRVWSVMYNFIEFRRVWYVGGPCPNFLLSDKFGRCTKFPRTVTNLIRSAQTGLALMYVSLIMSAFESVAGARRVSMRQW